MKSTPEVWKSIPGFETRYQASTLGRVKSLHFGRVKGKERILQCTVLCRGYFTVELFKPGHQARYTVHRLICLTFIGPRPDGLSINHKNGIKTDNRVENLEYCTYSENSKHSFRIGTQCNKGEKHSRHKLTEIQVREIYKLAWDSALPLSGIAARFNVSVSAVRQIKNRKRWGHLWTNDEKFNVCLDKAERIVAEHRAEVPEGLDPVSSWVAIGVAVASTAVTYGVGEYQKGQARDNAEDIYGRKPDVAPFIPIDLAEEQRKATGANMENADSIMAMIDRYVPGFSALLKQGLQGSADLMAGEGELWRDIEASSLRGSAWQAGQGGFAGTQMGHALGARDLGISRLKAFEMGGNTAQMWTNLAKNQYDPFTIDTMEQASATAANNAGGQATDQFAFNVAAAPDPQAAGLFNLETAINTNTANQATASLGSTANAYSYDQRTQAIREGYGRGSYQFNPATGTYEYVSASSGGGGRGG